MSEKQLIEALLTGRPYFGPVMRAMQGPPVRHKYLCSIAQAVAQKKKRGRLQILEIGSWAGGSAITWVKSMQTIGRKSLLTCIDRWQPYFHETVDIEPHYREMNDAATGDKILKLFLHNIRAARVSANIKYIVGDTCDILPTLPNAKFDIVYIDGAHDYQNARADIREAKRLIRNGGIICGDDLELQRNDVDEMAHRSAVDLKKDYVYSCKADAYYHPGVTEAVAVEFGKVSNWEGVWATRKLGSQWTRVELDAGTQEIPEHIKQSVAALNDSKTEQPVLVSATDSFNLLKGQGRFLAIAKGLGPTELFTERLGERELAPLLFLGESLAEVREKALVFEKETAAPDVKLVDEVGRYNIVRAGERFLAIAKELGPLNLFQERVGERELSPLLLSGHSIEEVRKKVMEEESRTASPIAEMVGDTAEYSLVKMADRFLALGKVLGPSRPMIERLGERELAPLLLLGESLDAIRQRALAFEKETTTPSVELVDEIGQYNIVKAGERFIAVAKELGPLDLFRERVGERELPPLVLIATDSTALRQKIEQLITKTPQRSDDS